MPRNIQRAYEKGTRDYSGKPGDRYWQNKTTYRIQADVDLHSRRVTGRSNMIYKNNSLDTLRMVRIKLAQDLWRRNGQRGSDLAESDIGDGVEVGAIQVEGVLLPLKSRSRGNTFLNLQLPSALLPGNSVKIDMEWSYIAPAAKGTPRACVCDSSSWFAAYWYPQIAVYDDLHGWADMPYTGLQEMYNDFADYELEITVPRGVMVWATGVWQNAEELLAAEYFSRYLNAMESDRVVPVFSPEDYRRGLFFFRSEGKQTFKYRATDVPDVAFGFSDHYLWDARGVVVDSVSGRRALVSAAYHPESKDYYEVCEVAAKGLALMSTFMPGYPYPYPRMTVFNGDDGMEFPMMCNDVSTYPNSPLTLTIHETSHTYFPFMMGINEQYYAWMDEGWAAFFDVVVSDSVAGKPIGRMRNYGDYAGTDQDMPPITPSRHLGNPAYRVAAYNRPQAAYFTLYQMLGYERFHRCLVTYMDRWKGRHPQPYDFFYTWNEVAGENLDWFWRPWFFDWGYPDLAVAGVVGNGGRRPRVKIENRGHFPVTIRGEVWYEDGTRGKFERSANVWKRGVNTVEIGVMAGKRVVRVELGDRLVSDAEPNNNIWQIGQKK